jgi:hypothetical protein
VIDSNTEVTVNSDTSISVGSWVHCVVVFDRDGDMKMYIDSVLQLLQSDISAYSALNITNTNEFNLGNVGSSRGGYYGDLKLDSVILFNKALTTGEVIRMYIDGLGIY